MGHGYPLLLTEHRVRDPGNLGLDRSQLAPGSANKMLGRRDPKEVAQPEIEGRSNGARCNARSYDPTLTRSPPGLPDRIKIGQSLLKPNPDRTVPISEPSSERHEPKRMDPVASIGPSVRAESRS